MYRPPVDASTESDETGPRCARSVIGGVGRFGVCSVTVPESLSKPRPTQQNNMQQKRMLVRAAVTATILYPGMSIEIGERRQ